MFLYTAGGDEHVPLRELLREGHQRDDRSGVEERRSMAMEALIASSVSSGRRLTGARRGTKAVVS
jgi:hypothetical protein